jgi:hypothetical protein
MLPLIDLGYATITLRPDGIIETVTTDNCQYDVKKTQKSFDIIRKLANEKKVCLLHILGQYTDSTKEAREYLASAPHQDFVKAEAFVLKSLAQRLVANVFVKINKPKVPVRFFNSSKDAEKWLKSL